MQSSHGIFDHKPPSVPIKPSLSPIPTHSLDASVLHAPSQDPLPQWYRQTLKDSRILPSDSISLGPTIKLSKDAHSPPFDEHPYHQVVGKILWLIHTHPNLSYSMSILNQYFNAPKQSRWNSCMCVLRYIHGTYSFGLHF